MQPVQALFFDLDNTLFNDERCVLGALAGVHDELATSLPGVDVDTLAATYLRYSDAYWDLQPFARGDLDAIRRNLWRQALADLGCDHEGCTSLAAESYRRHRSMLCEVYDDTHEVLEGLCQDYRLAVITNGGGDMQRARLRASGLERHFELVVASTDLDSGKPEPAIFLHVLDKLNIEPQSAWHIGDSLANDVMGAHNAGLTSVWLNRHRLTRDASQPQPHHEIASLKEIQTLLERVR